MKIPSIKETKQLLYEAATLNSGPWVEHSILTAEAARNIASNHRNLDSEIAYILGYLHDIGRRYGMSYMRHIVDGYNFLSQMGYEDCARICLTHSFPLKNLQSYSGNNDCTAEESELIKRYISEINYSEYDELIQLCDALATPKGFCLLEKRLVDVALRYGVNDFTVLKWKSTFEIKDKFEKVIGRSIYDLLPGVKETTFL
ncbi:putative HD superfamily hydrolase involved in NAD metabolism [Desulfosporosinus acidiphilus SJ4]|uniref:Putative HD superfamily hydrolase involved in NAD metabolism n=1 Tax=Desulfosporosinus acidiphilus (strain DSM 22704 / JCM 16185 / SJ4) TaxID=646529 RepID=I4D3S0_DESAJ|nr:HD domain-containing protein [Desulfosporosinus acidiphilus]AFM40444.1 putative HD superfamily hydrolase involved in NAD metabolism [Desulfosporosinus acidiphilus SJ4]